ncbi:hypothetical protein [Pseudomonas urmiensis]|uniref:hypothetical protein n=1 Tax=Pseudomonas urmiensis TaxID=2745493 RepID=UPI003D0E6880
MSVSTLWQKRLRRYCGGLVLAMTALSASAVETTLTAQYRGGGSGRFENTTPPASFCSHFGALCRRGTTVELPITYAKRTVQLAPDPRDQFYVKLPAQRVVDVYHEQTGESRRMSFQFNSVAQRVVSTIYYHNPVDRTTVDGPCKKGAGLGWQTLRTYFYVWYVNDPLSPGGCWSTHYDPRPGTVENVQVESTGVTYTLDIPPPYRLRAGIYRGSVTYSIGPGGDFDFGNDVSALSGDTLTINFELDVQHAFLFEFAPGSEKAVLEPRNGWSACLAGGRAPGRVYRDLPFRLWSTGPFKVYKLCQYQADVRCAIINDASHQVPVEVALSLPPGIQYQNRPVERLVLPTGPAAALQLDAAQPTLNRPGHLHFEVAKDDVSTMLAHPGSTYNGQVTVVFDAEL